MDSENNNINIGTLYVKDNKPGHVSATLLRPTSSPQETFHEGGQCGHFMACYKPGNL